MDTTQEGFIEGSITKTQEQLADKLWASLNNEIETGQYSTQDLINSIAAVFLGVANERLKEDAESGTLYKLSMNDKLEVCLVKLEEAK